MDKNTILIRLFSNGIGLEYNIDKNTEEKNEKFEIITKTTNTSNRIVFEYDDPVKFEYKKTLAELFGWIREITERNIKEIPLDYLEESDEKYNLIIRCADKKEKNMQKIKNIIEEISYATFPSNGYKESEHTVKELWITLKFIRSWCKKILGDKNGQ